MIDEKPLIKFKFLELRRKLSFLLVLTFLFHQAFSEETDLIKIYNKALAHDALLASVKFENQATQELISQGRSLFLPSITANIGYDEKDNERKILTSEISSNVLLSGNKADFHSYDYGITIKQPLFNYGAFQQYKKIISQTSLSEKKLLLAQQDLMYRVSLVYFETLMARDEIDLLNAQKKSITEQLLEARARYNAGLISITDVNEAQTKSSMIEAQKIAATQKLKIKHRQIESLTGEFPKKIKGINTVIGFEELKDIIDKWISLAIENNLELKIKQDEIKIAEGEINVRKSDRYPTIDAVATRSRNWDKGGYPYGELQNEGSRSFSDVLGVQINIPIFSGGFASSRVREAQKLKLKTMEDAEYLTGGEGSITIHNCRTLHFSLPSKSSEPRPLLLNSYTSADAKPYTPHPDPSSHAFELVRGNSVCWADHDLRPCLIPPDWSGGYSSIFDPFDNITIL